MALDKDDIDNDQIERDTGGSPLDRPERAERIDDREARIAPPEKQKMDVRSIVKRAIKEHTPAPDRKTTDQPRAEGGKFAPRDTQADGGDKLASPTDKAIPETPKSGETAKVEGSQTPSAHAAPASMSKETRAIWDTLPDVVKADINKRETDTAKGVEQLKSRYKPLEDAFAPYRGQLQAIGKTDADAVTHLFAWQQALASPNPQHKAAAFRELAKAHGFDLSTLTAPQQGSQGADQNAQADPTQAFRPLLDPVLNEINSLKSEREREKAERVQNDIAQFSQGKPHLERVRVAMGHLMAAGIATGSTPKEAFDDAYERACRQDPEVFAMIQQEAEAKREADAKAKAEAAAKKAAEDAEAQRKRDAEEVAKARKASVGPRGGSPHGLNIANTSKGETVGQSLRKALSESGARI